MSDKKLLNLRPFNTTSGAAAQAKRKTKSGGVALSEPVEAVQVVMFARQTDALRALGVNRSELIRELVEQWLNRDWPD